PSRPPMASAVMTAVASSVAVNPLEPAVLAMRYRLGYARPTPMPATAQDATAIGTDGVVTSRAVSPAVPADARLRPTTGNRLPFQRLRRAVAHRLVTPQASGAALNTIAACLRPAAYPSVRSTVTRLSAPK